MRIVYQIKCDGFVAYAKDISECDKVCAHIYKNGGEPKVRRMKIKHVPTSDIDLVANLL